MPSSYNSKQLVFFPVRKAIAHTGSYEETPVPHPPLITLIISIIPLLLKTAENSVLGMVRAECSG